MRTIAMLIDRLYNNYERMLWPGCADAARDAGVKLVIVSGEQLDSPNEDEYQQNIAYQLARIPEIEGIVLTGTTFTSNMTIDEVVRRVRAIRDLPLVSIGAKVAGVPAVLIENASGLVAAIDHLIEIHEIRKIAFIRGPESNPEADIRFKAYQSSLQAHGIAFDPALAAIGAFTRPTGEAAMRELLARGADFGAVACANDDMAMAAIEVLLAAGKRVPEDVAVVGFDDIDAGKFCAKPLTTVDQPVYRQAYEATRLLLSMLDGAAGEDLTLGTRLVVRRSCGCISETVNKIAPIGNKGLALPHYDEAKAFFARAVEPITRRCGHEPASFGPFMDAYLALALDEEPPAERVEAATRALYSLIREGEAADGAKLCDELLTALFNAGGRYGIWGSAISSFFQKGRVMVGEATAQRQAEARISIVDTLDRLKTALGDIVSFYEVDPIMRAVERELPALGIARFAVLLYPAPEPWTRGQPWNFPAAARIAASHMEAARGRSIDPMHCLGREVWGDEGPRTIVAKPLNFGPRHFGLILLEMGPRQDVVYETLRIQVSCALEAASILEENREVQRKDRERADRIRAHTLPMLEEIQGVGALAEGKLSTVAAMNEASFSSAEAILKSSEGVEGIGRSMAAMKEMSSAIDDIAVMINLLAINASIEAARAGAQGKGFAVIAQEVRKLAESTAGNAERLIGSIADNVKRVQETVRISRESRERFEAASRSVNEVSGALEEIARRVETLAATSRRIMDEIER